MELIQLLAGLLAILASAMSIGYVIYRIRRPPARPADNPVATGQTRQPEIENRGDNGEHDNAG